MNTPDSPAVPPLCPRCGYDLAGAVARWRGACDLKGTCTECGLDFLWRDVLNPLHVMPEWFFEHTARPAIGNLVRTTPRLFRPHRFWSGINMALPINVRRLVVMVVLLGLVSHASVSILSALLFARSVEQFRTAPWLSGPAGTAIVTSPPPGEMYLPILLWPYKNWSFDFTVTIAWNTRATPGATAMSPPQRYPLQSSGVPLGEFAVMLVPVVLLPLTYLILRQTLHRTRVRPLHLFRVFAYSWLIVVIVATIQLLVSHDWNANTGGWGSNLSAFSLLMSRIRGIMPVWLVVPALELALLGVWWRAATTRYLRLPHATPVVLAMLTITGLAMMLLLVMNRGGRIFFDRW